MNALKTTKAMITLVALAAACGDDDGGGGADTGSSGGGTAPSTSASTSASTTMTSAETDDTSSGSTADTTTETTTETTGGPTALLEDAKLLIEHNATDEDTGFQGFADGEPWNSLTISNPAGDPILEAVAGGGLQDFGMTEFFFETNEPENAEVPIPDVLERMPEGDYLFTADQVEPPLAVNMADMLHAIPQGPELTSPSDGATGLDPDAVIVMWEPVTQDIDGNALAIVGYEVIVEEDIPPEFPETFAQPVLSAHLPADATQLSVPIGFLHNNGCYKWEVLAIEESGNQTLSSAAFSTGNCTPEEPPEPPEPVMTKAKILIEHNSTDEDTGFQGFADGDPWSELTIAGPDDTVIGTFTPQGSLADFGLTELFYETSEPENAEVPIAEVLMRLPEGTYTFTGQMIDGGPSQLTATFTHVIPAGPVLTSPAEGATDIDPDDTIVAWEEVTTDLDGNDVTIVGYQVIVEEPAASTDFPQGFAQPVYSIYLPADATSTTIPPEFMRAETDYAYEVLAIEESGNQTLSSASFTTL